MDVNGWKRGTSSYRHSNSLNGNTVKKKVAWRTRKPIKRGNCSRTLVLVYRTSNAHPWFSDPFLKGLTWLILIWLSNNGNCMLMPRGKRRTSVLPYFWSPLISSWFILSKLSSIVLFNSLLYSNIKPPYLNDKRQASLDAIHRATCAIFSSYSLQIS